MGESDEPVGPRVRVAAVAMPLSPEARARLAEKMGPDFVLLDLRRAPRSTDVVIAPVLSP